MKNDIRYEIILYWSEADHAFIAEVPELAGCAADGATYQEAIANVEVSSGSGLKRHGTSGGPFPSRGGG
jgi:predicted RNase H-like HicB family nuclease